MKNRITLGNKSFVCKVCGVPFLSYLDGRVYCSRVCMAADYRVRVSAQGNPSWRGGRWDYKGRRWNDISARIIERDGLCADCGSTDNLVVHHLIPQRFWLSLDAANVTSNLVTLCRNCHVKRPEHYWIELPADLFDASHHLPFPPERTRDRLKQKPACAVCGKPCKQHRSRFCSYACSNRHRWGSGIYDASLADNFGAATGVSTESLGDI